MVTKASAASVAVLALLMIAVAIGGLKLLGHDFTGAATTACASSFPACNGACPAGQICVTNTTVSSGGVGTISCVCKSNLNCSQIDPTREALLRDAFLVDRVQAEIRLIAAQVGLAA